MLFKERPSSNQNATTNIRPRYRFISGSRYVPPPNSHGWREWTDVTPLKMAKPCLNQGGRYTEKPGFREWTGLTALNPETPNTQREENKNDFYEYIKSISIHRCSCDNHSITTGRSKYLSKQGCATWSVHHRGADVRQHPRRYHLSHPFCAWQDHHSRHPITKRRQNLCWDGTIQRATWTRRNRIHREGFFLTDTMTA